MLPITVPSEQSPVTEPLLLPANLPFFSACSSPSYSLPLSLRVGVLQGGNAVVAAVS